MIKQLLSAGLAVIVLTLIVTGCNDPRETPLFSGPTEHPPASMLKTPFKDPIEPALHELPSQALATWRDYARYRPTLVLFSTHPLLDPIPEARKKEIHRLLSQGSTVDIINRARTLTSDPAFLPPEAVSVAIDNGLFSELVFVLPALKDPESISLSIFREKTLLSGFLTQKEADELILKDSIISGTVRGIPFRIAHPKRLLKIEKPIILHVDLGYFKDMYINEVKTPSYELLYQLATGIRDANYSVLATTLSYSNQEIGFALESRFLIRDMADVLRKPEQLKGGTPVSWELRSKALYQANMFAQNKARELNLQAAQQSPNDAAAQHALALDLFGAGLSDQGFSTLDRAVAIDKGYALEYLALAEQGFANGKTEKSIELLAKAAKNFPNNPFIRKELANQLIQAGRAKEARPIITELQELSWSDDFYPEFPKLLDAMAEAASIDPILPPSSAPAPLPAQTAPGNPSPKGGMPGFNHMGMGIPGR